MSIHNTDSLASLVQPKSGLAIQAKLTIGSPGDSYEREADRMADRVMASPLRAGYSIQNMSAIQRKMETPLNLSHQNSTAIQCEEMLGEEEEIIQAKFSVQRMEDDSDTGSEPDVQPKEIQKKSDSADNSVNSSSFSTALHSSQGGGTPLPDGVRGTMESHFNADFSSVRVHTSSNAALMSNTIQAQAFTHGSDIYFNEGKYNPGSSEGQHLIAHELTHTVQQGAASVQTMPMHSKSAPKIQRSWLDDAWGSVSGAVSDAANWVGSNLADGLNWLRRQARDFVLAIPGYRLFTVVLGRDPITDEGIARNGRNFIEAGLGIIPNGAALKQKLEEKGALAEAAQWLDQQIAILDFSPAVIAQQLSEFWDGVSLTDIASPRDTLGRLANIFYAPIQRLIAFAENVAIKLLEIIKKFVISELIAFIRNQTRAYPLLTVVLGRDPISGETVERTPMALIRGFMELSESGAEQLRQMEESGSLQRAADWLNGAIARLNITPEIIRQAFSSAWDLVTIQNLFDPVGTFQQLYSIFAAPVGRIIDFLIEIAVKVLQFIKDALISRLVAYARTIRGYPLLTVILGRDPFSQEAVERNAENIIHGFMSLMEGGEQQFQEMKQTGAVDRLTARMEGAIARLNFTWDFIRGLFIRAWESFTLQDLVQPIAAFQRLIGIFGEPLGRLIAFIWEILKLIIEVALQIMNFPVNLINNIITRARQAIEDIKRDPVGFLKNLLRAVKTGFMQFFNNIGRHLLNGLMGWLFSELRDAGISPPQDLSFRSILGLVMDILGISIDRIFQKLARRIGQDRVDRIRGMLNRLTGIWNFVRDVIDRGPVAIWEYIQEQLSNLWNVVLEAIRNWVVTRVIQRVTARLLSMLDPTGIMAVVNGFVAFYNAVQSFIRYLREILEIVNSFVEGVAEIARGDVSRAANFLENSLARAMPVAIGFLANQVGLSGLGRRIGEMIERVREMVDRALDWLIDQAVRVGTRFLRAVGLGGDENDSDHATAVEWWRKTRAVSLANKNYRIAFQGERASARLMIAEENPSGFQEWCASKQESVSTDQQRTALAEVRTKGEAITTIIHGDQENIDVPQIDSNLDEMMSAVTRSMVGNDPESRIEAAQQEVERVMQQSDDTNDISAQFERIRNDYSLERINFTGMGTSNASVDIKINPERKIFIRRDTAVMVGDGACIVGGDAAGQVIHTAVDWRTTSVNIGGVNAALGTHMSAFPLANDHPAGQDANQDSDLDAVMRILPTARDSTVKNENYIKGHLLNDNLGGPANRMNLFPITNSANNNHLTWAEQYVKQDIRNGYVGKYEVNITNIQQPCPDTGIPTTPGAPTYKKSINSSISCAYQRLNARLEPVGSEVRTSFNSTYKLSNPPRDHRENWQELFSPTGTRAPVNDAEAVRVAPSSRYEPSAHFGQGGDTHVNTETIVEVNHN
jgi:hypothetical protein